MWIDEMKRRTYGDASSDIKNIADNMKQWRRWLPNNIYTVDSNKKINKASGNILSKIGTK